MELVIYLNDQMLLLEIALVNAGYIIWADVWYKDLKVISIQAKALIQARHVKLMKIDHHKSSRSININQWN